MKKLFLLAVICLISATSFAQNKVRVNGIKEESSILYAMNHPLHAWTGESHDVTSILLMDEAKTQIFQVAVSAKVASFDSKNANRDSHMMEVTEALKYPNVTFTSTVVTLTGGDFKAEGNLNFHGISQLVTLQGKYTRDGAKLTFTGSFKLKMTQFKVDPPSLIGISTDDDFRLDFKVAYQ